MADPASTTAQSGVALPPDDTSSKVALAYPDDPKLRDILVAGGTCTTRASAARACNEQGLAAKYRMELLV